MIVMINQILEKIKTLPGSIKIVAIDGRCGAGKSTFAQQLADKTGAGVIHVDDFFLPPKLRTKERLAQPGGNVHYERFREEVLTELLARKAESMKHRSDKEGTAEQKNHAVHQQGFSYRRFDCHKMALGDLRVVKSADLYIIEGAYSCSPILGEYMDLKIFADVSREIQLERILKRGGEEALLNFRERWIPLEEAYFKAYHIKEQADIVIDLSVHDCS